MSPTSGLRPHFSRAALAGILFNGTLFAALWCLGRVPDKYDGDIQKQNANIRELQQDYSDRPRLQHILGLQRKYEGGDRLSAGFLLENHIRLALSANGLPDGAAIGLFNSCWQINPLLDPDTQAVAVNLAIQYARAQGKDGLPYGVGESFSVGRMGLVPVRGETMNKTGLCATRATGLQP